MSPQHLDDMENVIWAYGPFSLDWAKNKAQIRAQHDKKMKLNVVLVVPAIRPLSASGGENEFKSF